MSGAEDLSSVFYPNSTFRWIARSRFVFLPTCRVLQKCFGGDFGGNCYIDENNQHSDLIARFSVCWVSVKLFHVLIICWLTTHKTSAIPFCLASWSVAPNVPRTNKTFWNKQKSIDKCTDAWSHLFRQSHLLVFILTDALARVFVLVIVAELLFFQPSLFPPLLGWESRLALVARGLRMKIKRAVHALLVPTVHVHFNSSTSRES